MFDEPLSNLDAKLRVDMRAEIRQLQQTNGTTAVYVTHDQEEAFSISDRVAIMNAGRIMQFDRPEVLYRRPDNAFVARFVGFENLVPLTVAARDGAWVTAVPVGGIGGSVRLSEEALGAIPDRFVLAARADGFALHEGDGDGLPATLGLRTYLGRAYQYQCLVPGAENGHLIANGPLDRPYDEGMPVRLVPRFEQCCVLAHEPA